MEENMENEEVKTEVTEVVEGVAEQPVEEVSPAVEEVPAEEEKPAKAVKTEKSTLKTYTIPEKTNGRKGNDRRKPKAPETRREDSEFDKKTR